MHSSANNIIGQTQLLHALSNFNIPPSLISNKGVRNNYSKIKYPQFGKGAKSNLKYKSKTNSKFSYPLLNHLQNGQPPGKRPKVIFIYK